MYTQENYKMVVRNMLAKEGQRSFSNTWSGIFVLRRRYSTRSRKLTQVWHSVQTPCALVRSYVLVNGISIGFFVFSLLIYIEFFHITYVGRCLCWYLAVGLSGGLTAKSCYRCGHGGSYTFSYRGCLTLFWLAFFPKVRHVWKLVLRQVSFNNLLKYSKLVGIIFTD